MLLSVPSAPAVTVLGRGSVLVWTVPEMPNGVIKHYKIRMIGEGVSRSVIVDAVTFYYEPSLEDLPHGSSITVQVSTFDDDCLHLHACDCIPNSM